MIHFRIRRTLLKMLKKRSYVVDAAQLAMTPRGFVDQFGDQPKRNDLTILAEHETDSDETKALKARVRAKLGIADAPAAGASADAEADDAGDGDAERRVRARTE